MSQEAAVAVVTRVLRQLVVEALRDLQPQFGTDNLQDLVTILPPDQARENRTGSQVNIYLYQVAFNPAWRNQDLPGRTGRFDTQPPALPLNLHYVLTFYGRKDVGQDDLEAHQILGRVMRKIHDNPVITDDTILAAFANPVGDVPDPASLRQVERVRFTPITVTTEELFKLWSGFQTPHRLSVAYEASVVLIESRRPVTTPLPVLKRGPEDRGPDVSGSMNFPALEEADGPRTLGALPGEEVVIAGENLDGVGDAVRFRHLALNLVIDTPNAPIARRDSGTLVVTLPTADADLARWAAGPIAVAGQLKPRPGDDPGAAPRFTNEVAFAFLPRLLTGQAADLQLAADPQDATRFVVQARVTPPVRKGQAVALLAGPFEFPARPIQGDSSGEITCDVADPRRLLKPDGTQVDGLYCRVRVDGVDSMSFDPATRPPKFDDAFLLKTAGVPIP